MNQVLIQLIYFVIYSIVFLIIGKLSFSESDSLSKFFVGERKNDEKRLFFTFVGTWVSAATILGFTGNVPQRTLCHRVVGHPVVYRRGSPVSDDGPAI